ncbi:MAG: protein adenylyltransferase SelO family protein, partial [Gemmatimonadales bacterium]
PRFDPDLAGQADRYERWLERTVDRTADLIAHWTAAGFAHGVMNTDNMSILGLTLDYGPYGFLDEYDPGFVCNHSDHDGRYAFDRQPAVGLWNLARLAEALLEFLTEDAANEALGRYPARFAATYAGLMRTRLGLLTEEPEDATLIGELLEMMAAARADYHRTLRTLAEDPDPLRNLVLDLERKRAWLDRYRERAAREGRAEPERRTAMLDANPKYVLRNYLAQEAIDRAGARDYAGIDTLARVLRDPYAEHPGFERYAEPSPPWAKDLIVSCSS